MSVTDLSPISRYNSYLGALDDATFALEVMKNLPPEHQPIKELTQALERVIAAVRALNVLGLMPLGSSIDLLDAIADGGKS